MRADYYEEEGGEGVYEGEEGALEEYEEGAEGGCLLGVFVLFCPKTQAPLCAQGERALWHDVSIVWALLVTTRTQVCQTGLAGCQKFAVTSNSIRQLARDSSRLF